MKVINLIMSIFLITAGFFLFESCATAGKAKKGSEKLLHGTWINTEYNFPTHSPKLIQYPNGRYEIFADVSDTEPSLWGLYTVVDMWTDSQRNTWYKIRWEENTGRSGYELDRISRNRKVYEYVYSTDDFPDQIRPNDPSYHIYYRQ